MKKLAVRLSTIVALTATVTIAAAAPAAAHTAGPCGNDGPGNSGYATHHIVPNAKAGNIGQVHKPGTHQGYSICNPSGR
jgi:hypothetical protein